MKRFLKITGLALAGILGFAALYFGAGWACSRIAVPAERTDDPRQITIYIKTNGAHTDIVVPVRDSLVDWSREIKFENTLSRDTTYRWLAIGWGDQGFFLDMPTWDDLTPGLAFRAGFWLSESAMHATFYHDLSENERCRSIRITRDQYTRLARFIAGRFDRDTAGRVIPIETTAQYGDNDAFYEARGRYNLFYSCNSWANDALRAAGQRCCLWTFFDRPIFRKYD